MGQMNLFIPYLAPSTNTMYAGQHWSDRVKHKSDTVMAVIVGLAGRKERFTKPVRIEVLPQTGKGKRFYDVSNYSYGYKLIEDALVGLNVLSNDTPEFVQEVCFKKTSARCSIWYPLENNRGGRCTSLMFV